MMVSNLCPDVFYLNRESWVSLGLVWHKSASPSPSLSMGIWNLEALCFWPSPCSSSLVFHLTVERGCFPLVQYSSACSFSCSAASACFRDLGVVEYSFLIQGNAATCNSEGLLLLWRWPELRHSFCSDFKAVSSFSFSRYTSPYLLFSLSTTLNTPFCFK